MKNKNNKGRSNGYPHPCPNVHRQKNKPSPARTHTGTGKLLSRTDFQLVLSHFPFVQMFVICVVSFCFVSNSRRNTPDIYLLAGAFSKQVSRYRKKNKTKIIECNYFLPVCNCFFFRAKYFCFKTNKRVKFKLFSLTAREINHEWEV